MSKKKISYILFSLIVILNLIMVSVVYADSSINFKVYSDKENVKPEEEITIKLKMEDLNVPSSNNYNVLLGTLNYDRSIFEEVQDKDIELLNDWFDLTFNKANGMFLISKTENISQDEDILAIKMKVKQDQKFNETQIGINEISFAASLEEYKSEGSSVTIKSENDNKILFTIIIISVAVVGLLFGMIMGRMIIKNKKGEGYNDFEE